MPFKISVQPTPDIELSLSQTAVKLDFGAIQVVEIGGSDTEQYTGEYEVTPKFECQMLPTAKRLLQKDVTVRAIPVYQTSNNAGGKTIIIG